MTTHNDKIDLPELNLRVTKEGWTEVALVRDLARWGNHGKAMRPQQQQENN